MNPEEAEQSNDAYVKQFCNTLHTLAHWLCLLRLHTHSLLSELFKNITAEQKHSAEVASGLENFLFW